MGNWCGWEKEEVLDLVVWVSDSGDVQALKAVWWVCEDVLQVRERGSFGFGCVGFRQWRRAGVRGGVRSRLWGCGAGERKRELRLWLCGLTTVKVCRQKGSWKWGSGDVGQAINGSMSLALTQKFESACMNDHLFYKTAIILTYRPPIVPQQYICARTYHLCLALVHHSPTFLHSTYRNPAVPLLNTARSHPPQPHVLLHTFYKSAPSIRVI